MSTTQTRLQAIAQALRDARRGELRADLPPDLVPATQTEAYRVQDLVIGDEGVAGWKIAATAPVETLSCAAITAASHVADGGAFTRGDRAPEVEVEIAIRVSADLPARDGDYTREMVSEALGSAHPAIEFVESRFIDRKLANPLSTLADAQSSRGFVIGAGVDAWRDLDLGALAIRLIVDGVEARRGGGGASVEQVVTALTWLANHASRRGPGLRAGQFVITGARLGPLPLPPGDRVVAEIDRLGAVSMTVV